MLDHTSFYADSGGQVGDMAGCIPTTTTPSSPMCSGCTKPVQGVFAHQVRCCGSRIAVGEKVDTVVDANSATRRGATIPGTHLLHAALREVLGKHVKQAGSLVDPVAAALRLFALHRGCRRGAAGH